MSEFRFRSTNTYLDMILLSIFFTQGASGSRQTWWPEVLRVALQTRIKTHSQILTSKSNKSSIYLFSHYRQEMMNCGTWSYMISVSSQWELAGIISTLRMWRPMGLLSVMMQRQCCSTPRLLLLLMLLPARDRTLLHTVAVFSESRELMHWGKEKDRNWRSSQLL